MAGFGSISAAAATPHAPLLQPILLCGHGNNLYPFCSSPTSASLLDDAQDAASTSLPKALLPILNRPMIAYPLQQLLSAGLRHAIILAPSEQHQQIASALKSIILIPPVLISHGRRAASAAAATAAVEEATKHPNISVTVGLSSAPVTAAPASTGYLAGGNLPSMYTSSSEAAVMRVDLLPLGPDDFSFSTKSSAEADSAARGKRSRKMGSAALITWLHSIGRLTRDPLIVPLDFIGQGVTLTTLIHSHVAGVPDSPTLTCLMYERGAGEGTGKEREKDGPPKLFTMYDRSPLPSSASADGVSASNHSLHRLLLLQDSDDIADHDSSNLHIRMSLLWSHPHTRISTSLLDSHIYIFNLSKLIGLLSSKEGEKMKSIREEVVPFVAKCSWMKGLREKAGWYSESSAVNTTGHNSLTTGQPSGNEATSSYVPWMMQASKEEVGGVRRSTTFVEPELLEGRSGKAAPTDSPFVNTTGYLGVGDARSSPLFTPDMSRAPSPRTKEAVLRSFTPVNPASPANEDGPAPQTALSTLQTAQLKALAKKSASEIRAVALIVRLCNERYYPIDAGLTIDEVKQREAEELTAISPNAAAEKFVARANTVPTYIECNRYLLRALSTDSILSGALPHPLPKSAISTSTSTEDLIDGKAQVSLDSVVGENTRVGERAMVKRSVVGRGCTVSKNAKITGCIVMDNVKVGENTKLENCIICAGATVEDKANLKDCDVAAAVTVTSGTSGKNEKFDE